MSQHLSEDPIMKALQKTLQEIAKDRKDRTSREQSIVHTKVEEAIMWRRHDLLVNTDTDFS